MFAVFTGVRREQEAIEKHISVLERRQTDDGYFISLGEVSSRPVVLVRTHMGEARIKGIAGRIFGEFPVSAVISARMGVGVPRDLRVGDIAICQKTFLTRSPGVLTEPTATADMRLMEVAGRAAQAANIPHMVGNALTVDPMEPRPAEQRALDGARHVIAVDTDGYWLAEETFARQVPFLSVRASLADVWDKAPQVLDLVGRKAQVSPLRLLRESVVHPTTVPNLVKLVDAVRRCCASLDRFSAAFLKQLAEQPLPTAAPERR